MAGPMGRQPRGMKPQVKNPGKLFMRLMRYVFRTYKWHYISVIALIFISVLASVQGTLFTQTLIDDYIAPLLLSDTPDFSPLAMAILRVAGFYLIGVAASFLQSLIMTYVTQGCLRDLRNELFEHMEKLPIKYFDTHETGDVLSRVTNDIDTIAQNMNQSFASLVGSTTIFLGALFMMFITNWIMALTAIISSIVGFSFMGLILGKSQKYFVQRQIELGNLNGYIEEIYSGHNVVKTYNGSKKAIEEFITQKNNELAQIKKIQN